MSWVEETLVGLRGKQRLIRACQPMMIALVESMLAVRRFAIHLINHLGSLRYSEAMQCDEIDLHVNKNSRKYLSPPGKPLIIILHHHLRILLFIYIYPSSIVYHSKTRGLKKKKKGWSVLGGELPGYDCK